MSERSASPHLSVFFVLVFALAAPFWLWGASGDMLLPGLPVSGLMAVVPAIAALLASRLGAADGPRSLVKSAFDLGRLRGKAAWLTLNVALFPALLAFAYVAMRLTGGVLPAPHISSLAVLGLALAFLPAGLGEELGWFGYAFPTLEQRHGPLRAALFIGVVWTAWHIIPYAQTGRPADWIAWHCLVTVATRVVAVWLFVNTGRSVLGAAAFHAMCNVSYFSFPNGGSHYDAAAFAPIVGAAALLAAFALKRARPSV
ncbi:CPBP family intramembrane glutamic endopeptidase [Terricaulis sp.]|uniref:CPBP family intramembrane glutamic endopeptidase n=1 Tax=Terricaulis sp. TaxID=2768686 RepID=UPI003784EF9F